MTSYIWKFAKKDDFNQEYFQGQVTAENSKDCEKRPRQRCPRNWSESIQCSNWIFGRRYWTGIWEFWEQKSVKCKTIVWNWATRIILLIIEHHFISDLKNLRLSRNCAVNICSDLKDFFNLWWFRPTETKSHVF